MMTGLAALLRPNRIRSFFRPSSICSFKKFFRPSSGQMDELKSNPFYSKYAAKLDEIKRTRPKEFQQKVEELIKQKNLSSCKDCAGPNTNSEENVSSDIQKLKLESVMNMSLIENKTTDEIIELWRNFHKDKICIYAAIPAEEYNQLQSKMTQFPNFVYPIPRCDGYEFFVQRWLDDTCHFTPLASYQQLKENAQTCLSIHHFTELAQSKGIVLMRAFPDSKTLSIYESQLLALQMKMYYGLNSGLKFNFVRMFNNSPLSFSYMDLVQEFENYKKDILLKRELIGTAV